METNFAIKAEVNGSEAYLQLTGYGKYQFIMREGQITHTRLRAKGGELVGLYDATRMNLQAVINAFKTIVERADLFPEIKNPSIVTVK